MFNSLSLIFIFLVSTVAFRNFMMITGNPLSIAATPEVGIEEIRALPAPSGDAPKRIALGETLKLDHLGPIIINTDGTTMRIDNWDTLTKAEQTKTWQLISARNQKRIEALKKQLEEAREREAAESAESEETEQVTEEVEGTEEVVAPTADDVVKSQE